MTNKHALPQEKHHYSVQDTAGQWQINNAWCQVCINDIIWGLYDLHPHHCSIIAAAGSVGIGQDEIKVLGIVNYTTNSTR